MGLKGGGTEGEEEEVEFLLNIKFCSKDSESCKTIFGGEGSNHQKGDCKTLEGNVEKFG